MGSSSDTGARVVQDEAAGLLVQERGKRASAGPAGGLLIAVGTSLILWAVIAQLARWTSALFF